MMSLDRPIGERFFGLRLDTLVRLRWLAVAGQTLALVVVQWLLGFALPVGACLAVVALSAWLNLALRLRNPGARRLMDGEAAWLLAYDTLQLAALLFLTGGLANPFALLFLAPVLISSTALSPRSTIVLGLLASGSAGAVGLWHMPLPWIAGPRFVLPELYLLGIWCALTLAIAFIGVHTWRVAEETRELSDALAATERVLAREQHLSALDGLAAAAAHELGTPLATITVVVKELARGVANGLTPGGAVLADDIRLLGEQVDRCRAILRTLTSLGSGDAPFDRMPISHLIEDVVAPHRNFGITIAVELPSARADEPVAARNPGLLYGLGNIVENAVDFAAGQVSIEASWTDRHVSIVVTDDGPGFPAELLDRLGEPYVTSRGRRRWKRDEETAEDGDGGGLGLGFFIAKTLLERSGAQLALSNRPAPDHGAEVRVRWPRHVIDISGDRDAEPEAESRILRDGSSRVD
ncbi:MAG TPA: ActS/PrrB/RegB family redox-sensitive histidine kinase [Xanthobacteraceae bacterium]|nr:ActS/PrrB/RegB family redox-sensitive histidine kinase [Xanthobacteraceae bacterium]